MNHNKTVRMEEMINAMKYLTDEVTNLRARLLQYELNGQPHRKLSEKNAKKTVDRTKK